jgi:integrase
MTSRHSTQRKAERKRAKPKKPHPDFPLFPHATGRWAKKIKQKLHFFGPWEDPDGAMQRWLDQKDDLLAGRTPRIQGEGIILRDLCERFLTSKTLLLKSGELSVHSWRDYFRTCGVLVNVFGERRRVSGLVSDDFEQLRAAMSEKGGGKGKGWGPVRLGNEINRIRIIFKWAFDSGLLEQPMRYGQAFKRPNKKTLRLERAKAGLRMYEPDELRAILEAATVPMRAMVLLGCNCGFGNSDCGNLPLKALNLETGWVTFPRPKTGISRRCPLWPETVKALAEALEQRPEPARSEHADLVFLTARGDTWAKTTSDNPISKEMAKLLAKLKIGGDRRGLNFYACRHTFETIGGGSRDQVAVDFIMGHARDDMASLYREKIDDGRLHTVVNDVRSWLFGQGEQ